MDSWVPWFRNMRHQLSLRGILSCSLVLFLKKVVLGDIFKGQGGDVWAKGMALEIEVENAATDEDGKPLPVKVGGCAC